MRAKDQAQGEYVDKAEDPVTFRDKVHGHHDYSGDAEKTNKVEQPEFLEYRWDLLEKVSVIVAAKFDHELEHYAAGEAVLRLTRLRPL